MHKIIKKLNQIIIRLIVFEGNHLMQPQNCLYMLDLILQKYPSQLHFLYVTVHIKESQM